MTVGGEVLTKPVIKHATDGCMKIEHTSTGAREALSMARMHMEGAEG